MEHTVITGVLMFVKTSSALHMDDIIEKDTPKGIDGVGIAMDIVQTENGRCYLFTGKLKQFGEYDYYVLDEWFRKVWAKHKIILKSFTLTAFSDGIYASWNYSSNPHHFDIIVKKKEEEFTDVF